MKLLAAFVFGQSLLPSVHSHGYLKTPRSRNYHASVDPVWWGGTATDPAPESCPHCLNLGGTLAVCGLVEDRNYDYPKNVLGGPLAPIIQACYQPGAIVDLEVILTTHHKGHFEYKGCAVSPGEVPTQECFDAHPLTFISDEVYGGAADPNYPERAYIPIVEFPLQYQGGYAYFRHKFQLPADLVGDLVILQWRYVTANSCWHEGYRDYEPIPGFFDPKDEMLSDCGPLPPDGNGVPEQVRLNETCF